MQPEIRPASLDEVRRIRHAVLRPHQGFEDTAFEHDDEPDALHLGTTVDGVIVAVATITREHEPGRDASTAWRVRGMATLPEHRGRGLGGELLERCVAHARRRGATVVWLNARTGASSFYERHGFAGDGDVFEITDLGPHVRLRRWLAAEGDAALR